MKTFPHEKTFFTTACARERAVARSSAHGHPHMHIDSRDGNAMAITSRPGKAVAAVFKRWLNCDMMISLFCYLSVICYVFVICFVMCLLFVLVYALVCVCYLHW